MFQLDFHNSRRDSRRDPINPPALAGLESPIIKNLYIKNIISTVEQGLKEFPVSLISKIRSLGVMYELVEGRYNTSHVHR